MSFQVRLLLLYSLPIIPATTGHTFVDAAHSCQNIKRFHRPKANQAL
jgi:hypothetical protein